MEINRLLINMSSSEPKPFSEFNVKDWKNFGMYLVLLGLVIAFFVKEWSIGIAFIAIGFLLTLYFKFIRKTKLY